jgi:hypothetical protein
MSDTVSRFPKGPGDGDGDPRANPDPARASAGTNESPHGDDWLDIEHHARVTRVAACDSARTRKRSAETEIARTVEEEQILEAQKLGLGGDEHVDAIMRSGWFPYADPILSSARLAWILDAVLWAALWLGVWVLAYRTFSHA